LGKYNKENRSEFIHTGSLAPVGLFLPQELRKQRRIGRDASRAAKSLEGSSKIEIRSTSIRDHRVLTARFLSEVPNTENHRWRRNLDRGDCRPVALLGGAGDPSA
jgi:hypothetical protein